MCALCVIMVRRPPRSTRTDTLFPYTTLFLSLVEDFVKAGGGFRTLAVDAPRSERASLAGISANGESLQAGQYVFACGPWLPKLFPEAVGGRIVQTRQEVFYFAPEAGDERLARKRTSLKFSQ